MAAVATAPVLVVHGHDTMVRILRNLLRQLGFTTIDEANDSAAALAKMRAKAYSVVVSLDTGQRPGTDLRARVHADEGCPQTPVVLVDTEAGARPFSARTLKAKLVPILGPF